MQGFSGRAEARTWLLPLMRQHVTGANLGYWGSVLLPTGRGVINYALQFMKLSAAGSSDAQEQEMQFRALEKQVWATLPAFARWPRDGATGLMYEPRTSAFLNRQ
jgi:ribosomal RNA-processing protein 12